MYFSKKNNKKQQKTKKSLKTTKKSSILSHIKLKMNIFNENNMEGIY